MAGSASAAAGPSCQRRIYLFLFLEFSDIFAKIYQPLQFCSAPYFFFFFIEFSYKNDQLHDPLLNAYHARALGLATETEIETIKRYAFQINEILREFFLERKVKLVDFKMEYGRLADGTIVLADEISRDTCRFWDSETNEKLDKDRFRRDMGGVEDAYHEMMKRVFGA